MPSHCFELAGLLEAQADQHIPAFSHHFFVAAVTFFSEQRALYYLKDTLVECLLFPWLVHQQGIISSAKIQAISEGVFSSCFPSFDRHGHRAQVCLSIKIEYFCYKFLHIRKQNYDHLTQNYNSTISLLWFYCFSFEQNECFNIIYIRF